MFGVTNVITVLIPLWGMVSRDPYDIHSHADLKIGLWTTKIGFHNTWEFWFYNVLFGLGQAPYYAYAVCDLEVLFPIVRSLTHVAIVDE